jgi:hypothetical protein
LFLHFLAVKGKVEIMNKQSDPQYFILPGWFNYLISSIKKILKADNQDKRKKIGRAVTNPFQDRLPSENK